MDSAAIAHLIGFPGSEDALEDLAALLPGPITEFLGAASPQTTPAARAICLTEPRIWVRETTDAYLFGTTSPGEIVVVLADDVQAVEVWTTHADALIRGCRERERDLRRVITQLQEKPRRSSLRR
ncbi:MAG: hypothetical protein ACP5QO_15910 [Clostridia bacterium]